VRSHKSYGVAFEVRTRPGAGALRVTGLDFYADAAAGAASYRVWSKEGPWRGADGRVALEGFAPVAAGAAVGRGPCAVAVAVAAECDVRVARAEFGDDAAVGIRGGGGSRSFLVALDVRDLWYSLRDGPDDGTLRVQTETPGEGRSGGTVVAAPS
jgi:hypothetical protein